MRFVGPANKRFNSPEAREDLLFLRKRVGQLFEIMKTTGQKSGVLRGTRVDGTEWAVRIIGVVAGHPIVQVRASRPYRLGGGEPDPEFYMDSGFIEPLEEAGGAWQTTETRALYAEISRNKLTFAKPQVGVDDGQVPPSHRTAIRWQQAWAKQKLSPGCYTGKLKWLVAGKLGLKDGDPYYSFVEDFVHEAPCNQRLSGEGIVTIGDAYWLLRIGASGNSGSATRLAFPMELSRLVRAAKVAHPTLSDPLETLLLAYAQLSETTALVSVSGDEVVGLPLGYGWKFNRNGDECALVTHTVEGDDPVTYGSHTWLATISYLDETESFSVEVARTDYGNWTPSAYYFIWSPFCTPDESLVGDELEHTLLEQGAVIAENIPLYGYYDKDGATLVLESYSRTFIETGDDRDECGHYICSDLSPWYGASLASKGSHRWNLSNNTTDVTFNERDDDIVAESGSGCGMDYVNAVMDMTGWSGWHLQQSGCCGYPNPYSYNELIDDCTTVPSGVVYWPVDFRADCIAAGKSCCSWEVHYREVVILSWSFTITHWVSGTRDLRTAFIIPFDCAEGVTVLRRTGLGGQYNTWYYEKTAGTVPVQKQSQLKLIPGVGNHCPEDGCCSGSVDTSPVNTQSGYGVPTTFTRTAYGIQYTVKVDGFFHLDSVENSLEDVLVEEIAQGTPGITTVYDPFFTDDSGLAPPVRLSHGQTRAVRFAPSVDEPKWYENYPEAAAYFIGWA